MPFGREQIMAIKGSEKQCGEEYRTVVFDVHLMACSDRIPLRNKDSTNYLFCNSVMLYRK